MATSPEQYGLIPDSVKAENDERDTETLLKEKLERPDIIFDYLVKISGEAENSIEKDGESQDTFNISDREYIDLLLWIEGEFDFETLFLNETETPESLTKGESNYGPDNYTEIMDASNHLRFSGFVALMLYHIYRDNLDDARKLFEDHSFRFDSDEEYKHLLKFFNSYIMHKHRVDPEYNSISDAIKMAYNTKRDGPNHYLVLLNFAEAVITAFESNPEFSPNFGDRDIKSGKLVEEAKNAVDRAKALNREYAKIHVVELRLHLFEGNYEDAQDSLEQATRYDQGGDAGFLPQERRQQLQRSINIVYDSAKLEDDIDTAKRDLRSIEDQLDAAVDQYRKNTLRFIGFFAALITFAITSVQILSVSGLGPQEAGRLIGMLAGGMLIAFGGFGFILPVYKDDPRQELFARTLLVTLLGAFVFILSYTA